MSLKLFIVLSCCLSAPAFAISTNVETHDEDNYFTGSFEHSDFKLPAGAITGTGAKVSFSHYFKRSISFDIYLSSALGGGGSATATGLGGYFYYTLFGDFGGSSKTVSLEGVPVLVERKPKSSSLQLGLGLDEFFLNGSEQVYSVSGFGFGAKYQFELFHQYFEVGGRYSMMSTNNTPVKGTFFGFGILFPL
jgi:hypothetical protein